MSRDTKYLTYHTTLVLDVNADSPKVVHSNSLVGLLAIGQTVPNQKNPVQIVISIFDIRFSPINYSKSRLPKHNTEGYLCELTNTEYTHFSTVQVYNQSTCRPHCASARDRFINNPKCIYWTSEIILGVSIVPYK